MARVKALTDRTIAERFAEIKTDEQLWGDITHETYTIPGERSEGSDRASAPNAAGDIPGSKLPPAIVGSTPNLACSVAAFNLQAPIDLNKSRRSIPYSSLRCRPPVTVASVDDHSGRRNNVHRAVRAA